jgi:hypothetical protein
MNQLLPLTPAFLIATAVTQSVILLSPAAAHSPVDFMEVLAVEPSLPIEHGVELQSVIDSARTERMLLGPQRFAHAVAAMNRPVGNPKAYVNWFRFEKVTDSEPRELDTLDMIRGYEQKTLTVTTAEYLLTPSQLISTGSPDPIPEGFDLYVAYRVSNPPQIDKPIEIEGSIGGSSRTVGKPVYVCLPARQWHHEEFVDITHPKDCFVVYELNAETVDRPLSTIDPFGLNQLTSRQSRWLVVRAALLKP